MAGWDDVVDPLFTGATEGDSERSIFAIRGSLDGEQAEEFTQDREQYIGLMVGEEEFLVPIAAINEIIMLSLVKYVPGSHRYVEGVFNLRGAILPALNVRKMMGLARHEPTLSTRIVIVRQPDPPEMVVGLIVDAITYVVNLHPGEIEPQNLSGSKGLGAELLGNISKQGDKVNGILDINKIVLAAGGDRMSSLGEAESEEDAA